MDDDDLRAPADALSTGLHQALPGYLERRCHAALAGPDDAVGSDDRAAFASLLAEELPAMLAAVDRVLHADVDDGAGSPLDVIRRRVGPYNRFLADRGATAPVRGAFEQEHFPDDVYDIGPASFREIAEDLFEPGIVWGAARAHVHLQRRAERDGSAS